MAKVEIIYPHQLTIHDSTVTRGTSKDLVIKCSLEGSDSSIIYCRFPNSDDAKESISEVEELADLPNLAQILGYQLRSSGGKGSAAVLLALITEWCNASLGDLLCRQDDDLLYSAYLIKQQLLSPQHGLVRRLHLILDMIHAINSLHSKGIAHKDLYSSHLWIRDDLRGVLAGTNTTSKRAQDGKTRKINIKDAIANFRYPAPEMIQEFGGSYPSSHEESEIYYDAFKADIYSLGIFIMEALSMKLVRKPKKSDLTVEHFSDVYREIEESVVSELRNSLFQKESVQHLGGLIMKCLDLDADQRPQLEDLKAAVQFAMDSENRLNDGIEQLK